MNAAQKIEQRSGQEETVLLRREAAVKTRNRLVLRWTDAIGPREAVVTGGAVIGSADGVEITVRDSAVSRIHAEIELRADSVWIRDLGSKNGTYIDGVEVGVARLPEGGRVRVGDTYLQARVDMTQTPVELWPADSFGALVGPSVAMREVFARLLRVARSESTVLLRGETGTGKDLAAKAIHDASARSGHPFVVVDCAAMTEGLLESELFGHARGSFTGAAGAHEGAFEAADKGTVFIDEVGELPLAMQPKLLRVLETRAVRRLGETQYRPVDLRFICATHRDLQTMVNAGAFREDLYFRLSVLPVTMPPLRERVEDIAPLIECFLARITKAARGPIPAGYPSRELLSELERRPWLGNVRELRNFAERFVALGACEALSLTPAALTPNASAPATDPECASLGTLSDCLELPLKQARDVWLDTLERDYVRRLLERHGRNVPAAAHFAGVNRTYIYRLIRKHDL